MNNNSETTRSRMTSKLLSEINSAKSDMETARICFDFALSDDEVDVCIYRLRAAETRYGALIKQLKNLY